jgi:class 3 adenylate cyclase
VGRLEEAIPGEGQLLNCVAMFIDIRDFTSLSSKLTPSQVFYLLTEVMSALSPHIRDHNGYIDKFLGDGALVIFDHAETHAQDALTCAKTFEQVIADLNSQTHDLRALLGDALIRIGVGMHLGSVMLGTVGSWDRLEFTILGDMVNIASRIEARTKHLGDQESNCVSLCSAELIQAAQWDKGQSTGFHKLPGVDQEYELFRI